jgi:CRP-like cAMP-binding protein
VGQKVRAVSATTLEDSRILRIEKVVMLHLLQEQPRFASVFMSYLLTHSIRAQEGLVDQLVRSDWRGRCCYWPTLGRKPSRRQSLRKSVRKRWPR